ncbi:MAG: mevalonate kinase [Candidatus Sericytochromatia bacterium]
MLHASACGKLILCGEHAVVYGQPALALPLPQLRAQASLTETGQPCRLLAPDLDLDLRVDARDPEPHPLVTTLVSACGHFEIPLPAALITVSSALPIARGLGSGTAISAALFRLIRAHAGAQVPLAEEQVFIHQIETLYHGHPSGIDGAVVSQECALRFVRGQKPQPLSLPSGWTLLVADSGEPAPTKLAVGDLRRLREAEPARIQPLIDGIGELVQQAEAALQAQRWPELGQLLSRNHALLRALSVSSARLDALVAAAEGAGALGAKLSGGGRGGVVLALTLDRAPEIRAAWEALGVARQWELAF